jgi:hypothetical protein
VFQTTLQGQRVLREWLDSPLDETAVKSELTVRVWSVDLFPPGALEKLVAMTRKQTQQQLEHMMGRRVELRDRSGPPETAVDSTVVGRLLVLEYEIEAAQLKLRWLEHVEAVHAVRALLEDSRPLVRRRVGHRVGERS